MPERSADVGVRLRLDDQASKGADRARRAFDGVTGAVGKATSGLTGFIKQALAVTVGISFDRIIQDFKRLGAEAVQAAAGAQQSQRHIGAMLMAASGSEFGRAFSAAQGLHSQLEDVGIAAGVSADSVTGAFETMFGVVQRAGGGIEDTTRLTENMTRIAGPLGLSMEGMAESVIGIQSGMVRARDPVVQLLRNFGDLDVKAKSFARMSEPQKLAALQAAFGKVGETMRGVPPGFSQIMQSFRDVRDNILEAFGTPIISTLGKLVARASGWLQKHQMEVEIFAVRWGHKFAGFIERAVMVAEKAIRWIRGHWDDITAKARMLPGLLAAGMALRAGGPLAIGLAGRAIGGAGSLAQLLGGAGGAARVATGAVGAAAQAAPAVTHFGQTLLGAGLRAAPAMEGLAGAAAPAAGAAPGLLAALGGPQALVTIAVVLAAIAAVVTAVGMIGGALYAFRNNLGGLGTQFRMIMGDMWQALQKLYAEARPLLELFAILAGQEMVRMVFMLTKLAQALSWFMSEVMQNPMAQLVMRQYGITPEAMRARDVQQQQQEQAEGRAREIGEWVARQNEQAIARAQVEEMLGGRPRDMTFDARGSTFNIKQDFRDQDPDRVAVLMREELGRAAEARITSRLAVPFGA